MNVKKYVRALLWLYLTLIIAMDAVKAQPLKVGDTLPPELWNMPLQVVNHPEGKEIITLSDYKDQLIILDFWATWCGACIKKFPETGILEQEFSNKLRFIGLTTDEPALIESFTKKYRQNNKDRFIPLTASTPAIFKDLFQHFGIPHYVWLMEGKIAAITAASEVSEKNIQNLLDKRDISLRVKRDQVGFKASQPLFVNSNGGELAETDFYRSVLTGKIEGLQKILTVTKPESERKIKKLTCINCSIAELFSLSYPEIVSWPRSKILFDNPSLTSDKLYSYELNTPPMSVTSLYAMAEEDFERYLNARGIFEEREIDCVVVTANAAIQNSLTNGKAPENNLNTSGEDSFLKNYPVRTLISHLNKNAARLLYVDETGFAENLDLIFHENIDEYDKLRESLLPQGLVLNKEKRKVRVFVIYVNP